MSRSSFLMISMTRVSFARMSSKSLIFSTNCLVLGLDLVNFQAGQLVQAQFQDGIDLRLAEGITAVHQPRFVADENADCSTWARREFKGEQLDAGLIAVLPNCG